MPYCHENTLADNLIEQLCSLPRSAPGNENANCKIMPIFAGCRTLEIKILIYEKA